MSTDLSLERAIQALRNNDRETARDLLQQLTQAEPHRPEGWLWLAAAHDEPEQKRACLQQVLALDPNEQRALAGLRALDPHAESQAVPANQSAVVRQLATDEDRPARPSAAASQPARLAQPRFAATGVRARRSIPWTIVALAAALVLLIPLALWLLGQTQSPPIVTSAGAVLCLVSRGSVSFAALSADPARSYHAGSERRSAG